MNASHDIALWVCPDCIMLFANGENPPEMSEDETSAFHAEIDHRTDGFHVAVGGPHEEDCGYDGSNDCGCQEWDFSWHPCGTCGSTLGGSRHAVTLFPVAS